MILLILQLARLARFANDVWRDTQRLRRSFPDAAGE